MIVVALRSVLTSTAAVCTAVVFGKMDCNPSLYLTDQWFRLRESCGGFLPSHQNGLEGHQRIWIIGASSGIGEELAYQLAESKESRKCDQHPRIHLILSSRSTDKLDRVAAVCRASNPNCTVAILKMDVCQHKDLQRAVQQLNHTNETITTVVLNSGAGHLSPALETFPATAESMLRLNALWPMMLMPLLFQYNLFESNRRHHVVVTSSIAGLLPVPLSATYAAAKHALTGYFRSLSAERPDILIHIVMPGPVDTDFHGNSAMVLSDANNVQPTLKPSEAAAVPNIGSQLKMSVQRCAALMRSTMRLSYSTESWIAQQPVLTALYLQQWAPSVMQALVHRNIGPRRVAMWRDGLDLYDPTSWKRALGKRGKENRFDDNSDVE